MSARTAWKLCSANAWWSNFGKKRGKNGKKPGPPVHDDLLAIIDEHGVTRHEFVADHANEVWLSDITEHWTAKGKLYLCAVKDVCSGRIVGYSIRDRVTSSVAVAALDSAVARRRADGVDVAMESFFALLQKIVLDRRTRTTREALRIAIVTWNERTTAADVRTGSGD